MRRQRITVPVRGQAVLCLRPVWDARGGPPWCLKTGGALSMRRAFVWHDSSYGCGFGAKSPVAGANPPLVPNCPPLDAMSWGPQGGHPWPCLCPPFPLKLVPTMRPRLALL
jgi:hypothetical protein